MKHLPVIVLVLFVGAEAFLKKETISAFSASPYYAVILIAALTVFLLSLFYFVRYFLADSTAKELWNTFLTSVNTPRWTTLLILGILVLGTFLRLWKLGTLFEGMAWDEAYKGLDAIAIRKYGERPVFLDWNAGREAMIAYLVAVSQHFLGYTVNSVRIVLALAGSLTILFFYLFIRTILNNNVALLSTFLLAVSKWHIIHSRYGVRIALIVLFQTALFYFIARGLTSRKNNSGWLIAAGAVAGAGFYTYIAYRITPVIVLFLAFTKDLRIHLKRNWKAIALGLLLCVIVLLPLAKFTMKHYETFSDRMERTAVWNQPDMMDRPVQAVLHSSLRTLGLMTYRGDSIARHNVNSEPMLSPFLSSFFFLGLLIVLLNIRKPYALFLLAYLFLTLLPGMLTVDSPHAARTLGAVVPVILISALGVLAAFRIIRNTQGLPLQRRSLSSCRRRIYRL